MMPPPRSSTRRRAAGSPAQQAPPPRRRRRTHLPLRSAHQSWLALLAAGLLYVVRASRMRSLRAAALHESFAPPLASLLHLHADLHGPLPLHLYTAPKPFVGADARAQLHALESWLALTPRPVVTLLGAGQGYDRVAKQYGLRREPGVDTSLLGVPLFGSLLRAANATRPEIAVLLNADIVLFDDFPHALRKIRRDFPPGWLAVAARWDVSDVPGGVRVRGPGRRASEWTRHETVRRARSAGVLHTYGGIDLWAWDASSGLLLDTAVPPFVYGRGKYDNWLTHEVIRAGKRVVVDVSEACTLVHVKHDHHLVAAEQLDGALDDAGDGVRQFWSSDARVKFELFVNSYLAAAYGSYSTQMGTILHAPFKLTSCYEHDGLCIFQRERPHACRCEHSPYVKQAQNDPYIVEDSRVIFCGLLSSNHGSEEVDAKERWAISGRTDESHWEEEGPSATKQDTPFGLPLVPTQIFKVIAGRTGTNKILLVVADYSERMLVMELVCSTRIAGIFSSLMIAALDDDMYRFCITRGLAVYLSEFDESGVRDHGNFKELARLQALFEVLKEGKEVLAVEPGVVFLSSPWKHLQTAVADDVNVGILPKISHNVSMTGEQEGYVSASLVYARPSKASQTLVKRVIVGLTKNRMKPGMIFRRLACGDRDSGLQDAGRCKTKDGPVVHLFSKELFRALESGYCAMCRVENPIAYYSAAYGLRETVQEVSKFLKEYGLSRLDKDAHYCSYTA